MQNNKGFDKTMVEKIVDSTAQELSKKLDEIAPSAYSVAFKDPLEEKDIEDKIRIVASRFLPNHLLPPSCQYPSVPDVTCDIVMPDSETKKILCGVKSEDLEEELELKAPAVQTRLL